MQLYNEHGNKVYLTKFYWYEEESWFISERFISEDEMTKLVLDVAQQNSETHQKLMELDEKYGDGIETLRSEEDDQKYKDESSQLKYILLDELIFERYNAVRLEPSSERFGSY